MLRQCCSGFLRTHVSPCLCYVYVLKLQTHLNTIDIVVLQCGVTPTKPEICWWDLGSGMLLWLFSLRFDFHRNGSAGVEWLPSRRRGKSQLLQVPIRSLRFVWIPGGILRPKGGPSCERMARRQCLQARLTRQSKFLAICMNARWHFEFQASPSLTWRRWNNNSEKKPGPALSHWSWVLWRGDWQVPADKLAGASDNLSQRKHGVFSTSATTVSIRKTSPDLSLACCCGVCPKNVLHFLNLKLGVPTWRWGLWLLSMGFESITLGSDWHVAMSRILKNFLQELWLNSLNAPSERKVSLRCFRWSVL